MADSFFYFMKNLFVPVEKDKYESRVALIPADAEKLISMGWDIYIEKNAGKAAGFSDEDYHAKGAKITDAAFEKQADFVVCVNRPSLESAKTRKAGSFHLSLLDPFNEKDLIRAFAEAKVTAASFEMIPRTTVAQKMDVLSSQANLAGYYSVLKAATTINKIVPMMMTPAGTISPLKFFIVGVGVAGLQAIATAKRLGARVEAFDTRPVVEEQVKSLGAKFVKIDLGETSQTEQGYAKELTPEQMEKQRKGMEKVCSQADVIITTAKLFARKAPIIITSEMVALMKPGSVIVDLAVESGGNVAGSKYNEIVTTSNGVKIVGTSHFESDVSGSASQMFSANVRNFIEHFTSKEGVFKVDLDDSLMKGCVVTIGGKICDGRFM